MDLPKSPKLSPVTPDHSQITITRKLMIFSVLWNIKIKMDVWEPKNLLGIFDYV
jgi:hypothetical protein